MRYEDALTWLYARQPRGIALGLDRVAKLFAALDDPQDSFAAFHVTGTNGKGSVCAMIASALAREGYRTGLYLSPHVTNFAERVQVDQASLSETDLAHGVETIRPAVEELESEGTTLTFFEIVTALAFDRFRHHGVEVAAVEVGMGGRLDATNLVRPVGTVITNVGADHVERLGGSLETVATEKAGIIKPGIPVVTAAQGRPLEVVLTQADQLGARCVLVRGADIRIRREDLEATTFEADAWGQRRTAMLALLGRHQAINALVAIRALEMANRFRVLPEHALEAIAAVRMPGRLERLGSTLLDGAHNPPAMRALVGFLQRAARQPVRRVVLASLADKDLDSALQELARLGAPIVATTAPNARTRSAEEVAQAARAHGLAAVVEGDANALVESLRNAPPGLDVVTGSLFLVGDVRRRILGRPLDPVPGTVTQ